MNDSAATASSCGCFIDQNLTAISFIRQVLVDVNHHVAYGDQMSDTLKLIGQTQTKGIMLKGIADGSATT